MSKYKEIDAAILAAIKGGAVFAHRLDSPPMRALCRSIAEKREPYRVIDGRLQAMRKAGRISYNHKTGWSTP
jgi:hypothetical protein